MADYIAVRESQIYLYKNVSLYCKSKENAFVLYKKSGIALDSPRLDESKHPELFIQESDKSTALKELFSNLNNKLTEQFLSKDLQSVRSTLHLIVNEAIENVDETQFESIPETIDILFEGYSKRTELLDSLETIKTVSTLIIEHTINVLVLTFRYCFFHGLSEQETKRLALCALLHDIGTSKVEKSIMDSDRRLTDEEYEAYTTHTSKGCDLLFKQTSFDPLVSTVAQEHHERIDGSGYPYGRTNISYESQLIGLIDCYEPLTYRDKTYRKVKEPFDSLKIIKEEVLQGKFQKDLFKKLCSCLGQGNRM